MGWAWNVGRSLNEWRISRARFRRVERLGIGIEWKSSSPSFSLILVIVSRLVFHNRVFRALETSTCTHKTRSVQSLHRPPKNAKMIVTIHIYIHINYTGLELIRNLLILRDCCEFRIRSEVKCVLFLFIKFFILLKKPSVFNKICLRWFRKLFTEIYRIN